MTSPPTPAVDRDRVDEGPLSRWSLVGAGITGFGLGLLVPTPVAILTRPVVGPTTSWRDLVLPGVVLCAVGLGLLTTGSYAPRRSWSSSRQALAVLAVLVSGVATSLTAVALLRLLGGPFRAETAPLWWGAIAAGPVVVAATALVAGTSIRAAWAAGPTTMSGIGTMSGVGWGRRVVSIAVMTALAAQVGVLGTRNEHYPLSPFPMYAVARTDDALAVTGLFVATTTDGRAVDIGVGVGVATRRDWVEDRGATWLRDRAAALARRHEARTGDELASYRVTRQEWE